MSIKFTKYHALGNSFVVVERKNARISTSGRPDFASTICDSRTGIGADGLALLSSSRKADARMEIYNADGGLAEKSGNGLRICGLYLHEQDGARAFAIETGSSVDQVRVIRSQKKGGLVRGNIGEPNFETKQVPVKSRRRFLINHPLKMGGVELPVTCVAVGNPHAVILVHDFEFDWPTLGGEIEYSRPFPNGTNVEFVKLINRRRIKVAEWERGVGATGSSGTGAAAAVCAMVMLGLVERTCEVVFPGGTLAISWLPDGRGVEVTGPICRVAEGEYNYQ